MKLKNNSRVLQAIAREHVSEDTNLLPHILTRIEKGNHPPVLLKTRAFTAIGLILLVMIGIIALPSVAGAMQRMLGYVPGAGLVEQSREIYILNAPVSVESSGITVTVLSIVADTERTRVVYRVGGIPAPEPGAAQPVCTEAPALLLPGGERMEPTSRGAIAMESQSGQPMSFDSSLTFPPLPAQTDSLVFLSPCQVPAVALALGAAPPDFATPVVSAGLPVTSDNPQPGQAAPGDDPESSPAAPTLVPNGSGLYLDQVLELEDAYLLVGNFTDAGDLPGALVINHLSASRYQPQIVDSYGDPVEFTRHTDIEPAIRWSGVYYWAYEIPKPVSGPVTITLDQVDIEKMETIQFQVDTGANPQAGQEWLVGQTVTMGGYDYVIDWVKMVEQGYEVGWHSGTEVPDGRSFTLRIPGVQPSTTASAGQTETRGEERVAHRAGFLVAGPVPTGRLTFELELNYQEPLHGPWRLEWTPPAP